MKSELQLALFPLLVSLVAPFPCPAVDLQLPLAPGSVRFAVIGDYGTGGRGQQELAAQMVAFHSMFPFDFVLTVGDNIYGRDNSSNLKKKFELPYKSLLDEGVKFYASLGNHDTGALTAYPLFNMQGKRYYTLQMGNVEFFALDSNDMDSAHLEWLKSSLAASKAAWKICFFHHPLYSDGKRHGSSEKLRKQIEPLLQQYGVQVVLSGHDHIYERIVPQYQIQYFIIGNSGQLRRGNIKPSALTAKGFDTDLAFMAIEVAGGEFHFQVISRTGATVDSGEIQRH
jgi:hypothetical protein